MNSFLFPGVQLVEEKFYGLKGFDLVEFDLFSVIKEEATDSRAEVKSFDHGKLKHVETEEKNPLPTPQTLKEELRPESLPDVSGVKEFDSSKLKHVETQEKTVLPTKEGVVCYHSFCFHLDGSL